MKIPAAFTPADSTAFAGYHIDAQTRALTIRFHDGAVWQYPDVALERLEAFQGAESKGRFFAKQIRPHHKGVRIG